MLCVRARKSPRTTGLLVPPILLLDLTGQDRGTYPTASFDSESWGLAGSYDAAILAFLFAVCCCGEHHACAMDHLETSKASR
eukprot:6492033-Amphidinium_carterae.1